MVEKRDWHRKLFFQLPRPTYVFDSLQNNRTPLGEEQQRQLENVLGLFGLILSAPVTHLLGAFRNETWLVKTTSGKKVLKRYKTNLDGDQIRYEHSVLRHLEALNFPAPHLSQAQDGSTFVRQEERYYAVFDFLEGYHRYDQYLFIPSQMTAFLYEAGKRLGQLHQSLDGFRPEGRNKNGFSCEDNQRWRDIDWYLEQLNKCTSIENAAERSGNIAAEPIRRLTTDAVGYAGRFSEIWRQLSTACPSSGIIHGDYSPCNLMIGPDRTLAVLDFELSRLDWRLIDLISLISTSTSRKSPNNFQRIQMIVEGYHAAASLPTGELCLLPLVWKFQLIRRLIDLWGQYQNRPSSVVINEVHRHQTRLDWVRANEALLQKI